MTDTPPAKPRKLLVLMTPERLFMIRQTMQMTQTELAEALEVYRVTVNRWENGARRISRPFALKIDRLHLAWKDEQERRALKVAKLRARREAKRLELEAATPAAG